LHEAGHERGIEDALALGDPPQGVHEDGDVGDALLEQVAEATAVVG